jgi:hypothetical protein
MLLEREPTLAALGLAVTDLKASRTLGPLRDRRRL